MCDESVSTFVISGDATLLITHQSALALWTCHHAIDRLIDGGVIDHLHVVPCSEQRRLIENVCEVSAGETGGSSRE